MDSVTVDRPAGQGDIGAGGARGELVEKAERLIPILKENRRDTLSGRRVADANVAAMIEAGLFRMLQPRRWGGFETDIRTHLDVVAKISEGCPSTGWVLGVLQIHSWLAAQFPDTAQTEIYADDPDARIAAVLTPRGTATRAEGGCTLSGFWPFASGCDHAQWLMLGARVEDGPDSIFLVPSSDVVNTGDWNVAGLGGTGSHSVKAEGLFVPAHRCASLIDLMTGGNAEKVGNDGRLYRAAAAPALTLALTGSAIGAAETAWTHFMERLPGRAVAYMDDLKQDDWTATHLQLGEVRTKIDTARLLLRRVAESIDEWAARGEDMPLDERGRARADCAFAVRLCLEAVETLYLASGGSALVAGNPIQLAWQDLHAANMHGILMRETNFDVYGRILTGRDPGTGAI